MVSETSGFERRFTSSDFVLTLLMACPVLLYVTPVRGIAIYIYTLLVPIVFFAILMRGVRADNFYYFLFLASIVSVCFFVVYGSSENQKAISFSVNFVVSLGMAFLLFCRPKVAVMTSKLTLWFLFSWYLYCLLFVGYSPVDANNYLYGASRNHVSFLLIISLILYYSTYIYQNKKFSLIPVILMVPASVQLYGRSGILVSVFIFLVVVSYRVFGYRKREDVLWGMALLILGFIFFSFLFLVFSGNDMDGFLPGGFGDGLDSPRWAMAIEYFRSLNISAFGFGSNLDNLPLISEYNGNPHNSYIVGHSIFGIFFVAFVVFSFSMVVLKLIFGFSRKRVALTLLFLALALRASSDSLFFYSAFDYIFLYLLVLLTLGAIKPSFTMKRANC